MADKLDIVIDTDAFNEADDQFAILYPFLHPERFNVLAVYAAPFYNFRCKSAEEGMEKSYDEAARIFGAAGIDVPLLKGSRDYIKNGVPQQSPAVDDLIKRARARDNAPLYVVAIGAITNIASALLIAPDIAEKIVLLWLGGHELCRENTRECNLRQDVFASRHIFACGVKLIHVPCMGVASHLITTYFELEHYIGGTKMGRLLIDTVKDYNVERNAAGIVTPKLGYSKIIWDIAPFAYLINPAFFKEKTCKAPTFDDSFNWVRNAYEHEIVTLTELDRDKIFADFFASFQNKFGNGNCACTNE